MLLTNVYVSYNIQFSIPDEPNRLMLGELMLTWQVGIWTAPGYCSFVLTISQNEPFMSIVNSNNTHNSEGLHLYMLQGCMVTGDTPRVQIHTPHWADVATKIPENK